jgi:hypothetical protein
MVVNLLLLFILAGAIIISVGVQSDQLNNPIFRKTFVLEVLLYLASLAAAVVIGHELFGPYIHWVPALCSLLAVRFVRMGYPNFLKIWRER